jgi:GTP-binding protein LepA
MKNIRNFCIVAHIDHGKSTLADRILEYTNTIPKLQMREQVLDGMDIERERGITIRSKTVKIDYVSKNGDSYVFNLIDTPGHVDFSYEISRVMAACEGALLLVDASQGVEAQTLANALTAKNAGLKIIPIINKIDLATADIEETKRQIFEILEIDEEPLLVSAKQGSGIGEVLETIVAKIPEPKGSPQKNLKALLFDSFYDSYRGVIISTRVFDGRIFPGQNIVFQSSNSAYKVQEVGYLQIKMIQSSELSSNSVGYIVTGLKDMRDIRIGDLIMEKDKPPEEINTNFTQIKPFVFAGIYNINQGEYDDLKIAMEKLHLNDASFQYLPVNSVALGPGFHCGFLGSLHMEVVRERLEREYGLSLIVTAPNVIYRVKARNSDKPEEINNPASFPHFSEIEYIEEPLVTATVVTPNEYLSNVIDLCKSKRGKVIEVRQIDSKRVLGTFEVPLSEIILGFYDSLKSVSRGYASFDYQHSGYKRDDLAKLEVLINGDVIDAFSYIVHESKVSSVAHKIMEKLKGTISRHLFQIPLQIRVENRIILRDDIKALRKDVIAKCYGGDVTRKRKLLEKQKEGKKKMKQFGKVEIPQKTFLSLLEI